MNEWGCLYISKTVVYPNLSVYTCMNIQTRTHIKVALPLACCALLISMCMYIHTYTEEPKVPQKMMDELLMRYGGDLEAAKQELRCVVRVSHI